MEDNLTLEQELIARIFLHKVAITGGVLMKEYIDHQGYGEINPNLSLEEMADKYSSRVIQQSMKDGTFETLYKTSWNSIVNTMPEYLKVI